MSPWMTLGHIITTLAGVAYIIFRMMKAHALLIAKIDLILNNHLPHLYDEVTELRRRVDSLTIIVARLDKQ